MPSNFGTTPLSVTTIGANEFPVAGVFVPGTASGNLTATQGGPASTDGNGYTSAPVAVYQATGTNLHVVVDSGSITDSGTVTANQGGSWTVTANAGSGTFTIQSNASVNLTQVGGAAVTLGSKTSANSMPVVIASDQGAVPVSGTFWQATQPVSGTVTANAGSGTFTVSGTVTANAGTGTFTNQQTNITADYDSGVGTQTMTMFGLALPASGGAVAGGTATNPVRIDPTGSTTQPVSGTITANAGSGTFTVSGTVTANAGTGSFNNASVGATASAVPADATYLGGNKGGNLTGLSLDGSGNLNVNVAAGGGSGGTSSSFSAAFPATGTAAGASDGTNMKPLLVDGSGFLKVNVAAGGGSGGTSSSFGAAFPATGTAIGASDGTDMQQLLVESATHQNLRVALYNGATEASVTAGNALKVDGSAVTQPVSGTVTANAGTGTFTVSGTVTANVGTTNGLALDTSVNGLLLAQGSTTSGESGPLIQGAVTTAAPTYTTAKTEPLSLTTAGALRVDGSGATQPVSGTVTVNAGTGTFTVSGTVTANAGTGNFNNASVGATGSAVPSDATYQGGIAETSLPTAASAGNLTGALFDKFGRAVMLPNAMRDLVLPITQLTLTATTAETTLIAAVASTFLDLVSLVIINTSASATQVDFRDSTAGTIRLSFYLPAGETRGISLAVPLPQSTVDNNWTAKCGTSVSSVIITGTYITNL